MQGFFGKPVDNLTAEPIIARWIRTHVKDWQDAVIVSKSAGGSKRVTSMADLLKVNFAIITTDRRRHIDFSNVMGSSIVSTKIMDPGLVDEPTKMALEENSTDIRPEVGIPRRECITPPSRNNTRGLYWSNSANSVSLRGVDTPRSNPLPHASILPQAKPDVPSSGAFLVRSHTAPNVEFDEYTDGKAQEIVTGRFIHGHIVDDDFPSPMLSTMSGSIANLPGDQIGQSIYEDVRDPMTQSIVSTVSSLQHDAGFGGKYDGGVLSDEEEDEEKLKDPELEHTVTLVGRVNGKPAILLDDILDRSESWIAAAETIVKRGGATKVYCMATHGLFGDDSLASLEKCDCISQIIVCDTFPIDPEAQRDCSKLVVLPMAGLLAEAIRRNQHGESLSEIYRYYQD